MKIPVFLCVLAVAKPGLVFANTLGFVEIARSALADYPSIEASASDQRAAAAELAAARWQRFPTPEVQVSQDDAGVESTLLRVQQPLWTGGRISAGINAARARANASESGIGEAEQQVLLEVAEVYVEAVRRQEQQKISVENVGEHEELRDLIKRRVNQEISPKVDLALANSRLAQASSELSAINQQLSIALDRLSELAGVPVDEVLPELHWQARLPGSRAAAENEAMAYSPKLNRLAHEQIAASADVQAERAGLFPIVAVRLEHQNTAADETRALLVLESEFDAGLSTLATSNAAASRRNALRRERQTAERELRTEVAAAWQRFLAAQVRLENARQQMVGTRSVFESYTRQYVIGQKSWLDVLNAVRESTRASLSVEDARAEMRTPMLRLGLLTGRLGVLAAATRYTANKEAVE